MAQSATPAHLPKPTKSGGLEATPAGATVSQHTYQFAYQSVPVRGQGYACLEEPWASAPPVAQAPPYRRPRSPPFLLPSRATPVARGGGVGKQAHCCLGHLYRQPRVLGSPRLSPAAARGARGPSWPQLLPGERVGDPVAPPLLGRLRLPLIPGPVPAVSAAALRAHQLDRSAAGAGSHRFQLGPPGWEPGTDSGRSAPRPSSLRRAGAGPASRAPALPRRRRSHSPSKRQMWQDK
ncbi:Hypothetical predicted protein [Marmota monax]|uniref:Uncharacterized protein n=1 Tax=Marmota monax TaxID=9995 RepID=A0A5E4BKL1_MARMO|nr:Hypothetical predicted protein [Marmota monax]